MVTAPASASAALLPPARAERSQQPWDSELYQVVRDNVETLHQASEDGFGSSLSGFVREEQERSRWMMRHSDVLAPAARWRSRVVAMAPGADPSDGATAAVWQGLARPGPEDASTEQACPKGKGCVTRALKAFTRRTSMLREILLGT